MCICMYVMYTYMYVCMYDMCVIYICMCVMYICMYVNTHWNQGNARQATLTFCPAYR